MGALAFTVGGVAFCSRCDLRPVAARRGANGGELEHGGRLILHLLPLNLAGNRSESIFIGCHN